MKLTVEQRLQRIEDRLFPKADTDGWITNGYPGDTATQELLAAEFGKIREGAPKATPTRTVAQLQGKGIIGLYQVRK